MDRLKHLPNTPLVVALLNLTQFNLLVVDESGRITDANRAALKELGYTKENMKERTIFEINPHFSFLSWKKVWKQLEVEKSISEQSEIMTADNVLFPVKTSMFLSEKRGEKRCIYMTKNLLNTSRHKNLLELTATLAKIGSWEYDLVKRQIILGQETMALLGFEKQERKFSISALLLWLRQYLSYSTIQRLLRASRTAMEQGTPFELDIRVLGKPQTFQIHAIPQASEGITARLYGIIKGASAQEEEKSISHFITENAIEMIGWGRDDGMLVKVNQAFCDQSGFSKSALTKMRLVDLFVDLDKKAWKEKWKQLNDGDSLELEVKLRQKSGKVIPTYLLLKHLRYHEEDYYCAFMRSLVVKKNREELLDLMYHTLNQSNDMIVWIKENGQFAYVNDTILNKLGYSRTDLEKMPLSNIMPEYEADHFWEWFKHTKYLEGESSIRTKDGKEIPVETIQTYLEFKNEKIGCITFRDISAHKKKEKELEKATKQIQLLKEKLEGEKTYLREEVSNKFNFNNIISQSERYRKVLKQVARVASTNATVLILGETGTGKELLARAIHTLSDRDEEPMVKINCAALPENLIESELFGHEKGAFTGAHQRKIGRFELADQGTIFLDEVGELPLELQAKLLRVLQEGTFERLGSTETQTVDVRVVAATNRKLEKLVEEGRFRQDLYYRLNVFPIVNLPLRERREDIPLLVQFFVKKNCEKAGRPVLKIPQGAVDRLMLYHFPGNIRELENIVERAVILSQGKVLKLDAVISNLNKQHNGVKNAFLSFEDMQRKHILEALEQTNWKITGKLSAAQLLKMNGKTLASKMRKLGIKREDFMEAWTEQL